MQRRQPRSTRTDTRLPYTPLFRSRTVDRYQPGVTGKPARMHGLFFGLFGPNAPLPLHLTEYAMDRQTNARDSTFTAFANIFRSEEHTSELQSLMRISYAVFCLKKKKNNISQPNPLHRIPLQK